MPLLKHLKQHKLLLDTHVWIWLHMGNNQLTPAFRKSIEQIAAQDHIFVSAISLWELGMLVERKRIELEMDALDWAQRALESRGINLLPLSPSIAIESSRLPDNSHGDPADRILIATAREHHAVLVTHDEKILNYGKGKFINVYDPC